MEEDVKRRERRKGGNDGVFFLELFPFLELNKEEELLSLWQQVPSVSGCVYGLRRQVRGGNAR
jgi:hypothetical protein